ncbi:glycosyltransferase family 4 protein [Hoeflea sp. TYP-13]|uniref:glycosyltransferase family 4 protein n=1 Tax=Hoeflea sp. TYP-13 TaxID=3230023 RepID=UPI0034C64226
MRILLTVNASWNIVNFRRGLVEDLLQCGHQVTVLAPPDHCSAALVDMGCRFIPLNMDVKGLSALKDLRLLLEFRRVFHRENPDVILGFTVKNNVFGAMAARLLGIAFVPNVTGLGTAFLSDGLLRTVAELLYRVAFRKAPVVFFQNSDDRGMFLQRGLVKEQQARLLPGSGIDLEYFSPLPPPASHGLVFLMIARLIKDKGLLEFVEAARRMKRAFPHARFQVLGAIGAENRGAFSAECVASWQREGIIEHLGQSADVRRHIAKADCVVLPSYREGAPRALIEAAAMARTIITTDVPGCRAVLDDGVTGFLCKARCANSLAEACERFANLTQAGREAMGMAGRIKMEREFDQAFVIDAYNLALADISLSGRN